jgi:putative flippase GtrA
MLLNRQFNRFIFTGILNTINGYAWILGIQFLTAQPLLANMLGYAISALISYATHSRFTFRQRPTWRNATGYFVVICTCYAINLVVLQWSLGFLPAMVAQMLAVSVFVVLSYIGQSKYAFRQQPATSRQQQATSNQQPAKHRTQQGPAFRTKKSDNQDATGPAPG